MSVKKMIGFAVSAILVVIVGLAIVNRLKTKVPFLATIIG